MEGLESVSEPEWEEKENDTATKTAHRLILGKAEIYRAFALGQWCFGLFPGRSSGQLTRKAGGSSVCIHNPTRSRGRKMKQKMILVKNKQSKKHLSLNIFCDIAPVIQQHGAPSCPSGTSSLQEPRALNLPLVAAWHSAGNPSPIGCQSQPRTMAAISCSAFTLLRDFLLQIQGLFIYFFNYSSPQQKLSVEGCRQCCPTPGVTNGSTSSQAKGSHTAKSCPNLPLCFQKLPLKKKKKPGLGRCCDSSFTIIIHTQAWIYAC